MINIIIDFQSYDTWKTHLTIAIYFISSKDTEEECVMYPMTNNIKFTSFNDANKVVNELFESLLLRYQDNLKISMRGSDWYLIQFD